MCACGAQQRKDELVVRGTAFTGPSQRGLASRKRTAGSRDYKLGPHICRDSRGVGASQPSSGGKTANSHPEGSSLGGLTSSRCTPRHAFGFLTEAPPHESSLLHQTGEACSRQTCAFPTPHNSSARLPHERSSGSRQTSRLYRPSVQARRAAFRARIEARPADSAGSKHDTVEPASSCRNTPSAYLPVCLFARPADQAHERLARHNVRCSLRERSLRLPTAEVAASQLNRLCFRHACLPRSLDGTLEG